MESRRFDRESTWPLVHDPATDRTVSATIEYLKALRQQQLGQAVDVVELEQRAKTENAATMKSARQRRPKRSETALYLTAHARQRMAQRGLRIGDVYAIYLHGEAGPDWSDRRRQRYQITARALERLDGHHAKQLRRLEGAIIVVAAPDVEGRDPAVITVLRGA
jgi:hypothetical protein